MERIQRYPAHILEQVIVAIGILVVVIAPWLPVGLRVTGIGEEWYGRVYLEAGDVVGENVIDELATRPASIWPFRLAYILTPDSFVGNNLITIFLLWGKGFTLYLILWRLIPDHVLPAFFVAVIFTIYPADTAIVSLRISHMHTNILFFLVAVYLLLLYWATPRWRTMVAIWGLLGGAMLMNENTYPLILLTPLLLFLRERRITRRLVVVSCLWYAIPLLTFMFSFYMIFIRDVSFQGDAVAFRAPRFYWDVMVHVYWENLMGGWVSAASRFALHSGWKEYATSGFAAVTAVGCSLWFLRYEENRSNLSIWEILTLVITSLIMVGAAFAMYLPTNRANERLQFRVFLLTSLGAATFWGYSLYFLTRLVLPKYSRHLYILGTSFLVALAVARAVYVQKSYADIAEQQEFLLAQVIRQVPQLKREAFFVFIPVEEEQRFSTHNLHFGNVLAAALRYIYEDYTMLSGAVMCQPQALLRTECTFNSDTVVMKFTDASNNLIVSEIRYENLVIFEVAPDGTVRLLDSVQQSERYQPSELIDESAPPPRRIHTVFGFPLQ